MNVLVDGHVIHGSNVLHRQLILVYIMYVGHLGHLHLNKDVIEIGELAGRKELHRQRRKQVENDECGSSNTDTNNNDENNNR